MLNISEMNQIIFNFLNSVSKKFFYKLQGNFYFEIFRILLHYINTYNNKLENYQKDLRILFDLHRILTDKKNLYEKNFLLFEYHYKKISQKKFSDRKNNQENKIINYFELNNEFQKLSEDLRKTLLMFKDSLKVDIVLSRTKKIFDSKKKIKQLIKLHYSTFNRENVQDFFINFHYLNIFNSLSKKLNILEINMEFIDIVEENLEKNDKILFEYTPMSRNFIFKSINSEFLSDLKFEYKNLKGENISKIFPNYILRTQINKILNFLDSESRESYVLKCLVHDSNYDVKFVEFSFKIIINLNLKIFLSAKYKNLNHIGGDKISESVNRPRNILVLNDKAWIISQSEHFRYNILKNENGVKNFNNFIKIGGEFFLRLFTEKKNFGKLINLKTIEKYNQNSKYNKNTLNYENTIPDNCETDIYKYSNINKNFDKKENQKNLQTNTFNTNNLSLQSIDDQTFNSNRKRKPKKHFIEFNTFDLFDPEFLLNEKENFSNYKIIKIYLEETFKFQQHTYFILDFEKILKKNAALNKQSIKNKYKIDELNSTNLKNLLKEASLNYSANSVKLSIQSCNYSNYSVKQEESLTIIFKNKLKSYLKIKEKTKLKKIEFSVYTINIFLILIGIIFILVFGKMIQNFQYFFTEGYYNFRKLQVRYTVQTLYLMSYLNKHGDFFDMKFWNDPTLDNIDLINDIINKQDDLLQSSLKIFDYFLLNHQTNLVVTEIFSKKIVCFDFNPINNSFFIKNSTFKDLLSFYYSNYLIIKGKFSKDFSTNLDIKELQNRNHDEITAMMVILKNYFSVLDNFFEEIVGFFTDELENQTDNLSRIIFYYNLFFLLSHLIIIIIIFLYIFFIYKRFANIFKFLSNVDKQNQDYLLKKFDMLIQSTRFLLNPKEYLSKIKNLKKNIIESKKNKQNNNLNKVNKKKTEIYDNLVDNKIPVQLMDNYENKNNILSDAENKNNFMLKKNLIILKIEIKTYLYQLFLRPLIILFLIYLILFISVIFLFENYFYNIKAIIKFTNSIYDEQINLYNGYIVFKIGYVSNMNIDYIQKSINISNLNTNGVIFSEDEQNKYLYLNKFEKIYKNLMEASKTKNIMEKNNKIFLSFEGNEYLMKLKYFCNFSVDKSFVTFRNIENSENLIKLILNYCQENFDDFFELDNFKVNIFNNLRNYLLIIVKNKENKNLQENILDWDYKRMSNFLGWLVRPYYNKLRDTIVAPFLTNELNNTLNVCVIVFVTSVALDILCLLIINFYIFKKTLRINKYFLNFIEIIKN